MLSRRLASCYFLLAYRFIPLGQQFDGRSGKTFPPARHARWALPAEELRPGVGLQVACCDHSSALCAICTLRIRKSPDPLTLELELRYYQFLDDTVMIHNSPSQGVAAVPRILANAQLPSLCLRLRHEALLRSLQAKETAQAARGGKRAALAEENRLAPATILAMSTVMAHVRRITAYNTPVVLPGVEIRHLGQNDADERRCRISRQLPQQMNTMTRHLLILRRPDGQSKAHRLHLQIPRQPPPQDLPFTIPTGHHRQVRTSWEEAIRCRPKEMGHGCVPHPSKGEAEAPPLEHQRSTLPEDTQWTRALTLHYIIHNSSGTLRERRRSLVDSDATKRGSLTVRLQANKLGHICGRYAARRRGKDPHRVARRRVKGLSASDSLP